MVSKTANPAIKYSLVIPIFNEEAVLPLLMARVVNLLEKLDGSCEAIFVDDGSADTGPIYVGGIARDDQRIRLIKLSRNFGHQVAITAGMQAASGDAIIVMDADLQDPPELVLQMVEKWKEGNDIVYARRTERAGETWFKKSTANLYYRMLDVITDVKIPRDVGDFRLVSRKALDAFLAMPERDRFVRGMFGWLGFQQAEVLFERPERAAGETHYPLWKMMRLAVHGMISFSEKPLRLALWFGLAISGLAAFAGFFAIGAWMFSDSVVDGWTSTLVVISFLSGINLFMTGIVGLYVGGIHAEVKRRPLYVVDETVGLDRQVVEKIAAPHQERRLAG